MNNDRILQPPEASYGFSGACSHSKWASQIMFNLGIFKIEQTDDGKKWKRGKTVCRVKAYVCELGNSQAKETAELICRCLEADIPLHQKSYIAGCESNAKLCRLLERS